MSARVDDTMDQKFSWVVDKQIIFKLPIKSVSRDAGNYSLSLTLGCHTRVKITYNLTLR